LLEWIFAFKTRRIVSRNKTTLNYLWSRERREAQKLLNRSEKKLQARNAPQGCLKD